MVVCVALRETTSFNNEEICSRETILDLRATVEEIL